MLLVNHHATVAGLVGVAEKWKEGLYIIAGRATPALRCGRTIAGLLPQLFSLINDFVINKSKICWKCDSVAGLISRNCYKSEN